MVESTPTQSPNKPRIAGLRQGIGKVFGGRAARIRVKSLSAAVGLGVLSAACAYTPPENAPTIARPDRLPTRNVTGFSEALRCMDELLLAYGIADVIITSDGIPDATGKVAAGTKEMLISAISKMSVRSGAFRFVDFDQGALDVNALQNLVGFTEDFRVPQYYLRGAVTQLDEGVVSESVGASIAYDVSSAGAAADQTVSVVSLDLNVGDLLTRQILSGTTSNNSIAVRKTGVGGDAGGEIVSVGIAFQVNFNRSEGTGAAVRTLIELSVIESLGRLTRVPYWRCLSIEQTNPAVEAEARNWYSDMTELERVRLVQAGLKDGAYYRGPISGVLDVETRNAIGSYQAANGLIGDGRINFDLYASLISGDLAVGKAPGANPNPRLQPAGTLQSRPLSLYLASTVGTRPVYNVGAKLSATLRPTDEAYVTCYYQDARGDIMRIFPNRFQPDARIAGGTETQIPGPNAPFDIVFDTAGVLEELMCLASDQALTTELPENLRGEDLAPLRIATLEQVKDAYRRLELSQLVDVRLPIEVVQ